MAKQQSAIDDEQSKIENVACPFCHSTDTEMIALFGMQMMTSQHYCRHCRSAFEAIKWDQPPGTQREDLNRKSKI